MTIKIPITIISSGGKDRNSLTEQLLQKSLPLSGPRPQDLVGHIHLDDELTIQITNQALRESIGAPQDTDIAIICGSDSPGIELLDKGIDFVLDIFKKFINSKIKIGEKTFASQTDIEELKKQIHDLQNEVEKLKETKK